MAPFCSCPASLVSGIVFAVGPGCAKCFFWLRSVGRRDLSAGPEQKNNTTQGVFFLAAAPGKGRGRRSPVPARGQSKKKHHPGCFFFAAAPAKGKEKPRWAPARGQSKKQKETPPRVCFFLLRPRGKAGEGEAPLGAGTGPEQKKTPPRCVFFILPWPRAGAQRGFSFPCLSPGPEQKKNTLGGVFFCSGPVPAPNGASPSLAFRRGRSKKNTLGGVFFFCSGPVPARGFSFPCLSPGPEQKKKTPWVVLFVFAAAPRGRSLTHCGPGWRCLPLAGVVFVFFCCGPARTGVVFWFLLWPRPDAHSLTVGWGDFGKARVVFVFVLRPRRVFLDNNKKCLGYYIGSKKTRRGHSKKKKKTLPTARVIPKYQDPKP